MPRRHNPGALHAYVHKGDVFIRGLSPVPPVYTTVTRRDIGSRYVGENPGDDPRCAGTVGSVRLKSRLAKLEPDNSRVQHTQVCRDLWREIADSRARYNALEVELCETLEPEAVRLLGSQGENVTRHLWRLIAAVIREHHLHGYPLALPTALLQAFLARSEDFYSSMNLHACPSCGYGTPYCCWQTGVRDFHAVLEYDFLLGACPLCRATLEPGKTYVQEHSGYPNGKGYSEVPPLILYPFENSRLAGTKPSDFGVTMPEGWEA